ncbi:Rieske 2Fe-2S domain-containing protein [Spongiibacter sp. KMU-166]|uniref:cholesterol 7-desaturase n=1 Tax=Spongiibacter thalassae TaxID=2721624 RepID=A0ABX1GB40_9GAMM|nr:Rieske 2Fe-2S domain-containing protein [Spongiibacter thalassae]NKI16185.1 Rieske 2Fe-2S domain-containing protein [Spongiibacter thalassae]
MNKRYNKPIPCGWFAIDYCTALDVGEVKPLRYFGRDLVLFRTESGEASLIDAHCPHLGAHLGHGGKVKGENIACPFHAWEFGGDGFCKNVPYAKNMPPKVVDKQALRTYPVVELNQMIWAWYHPSDAPPQWEVEKHPELHSDEWSAIDVYEWQINAIIQETGENAVDIAHFVTVHESPEMPVGEVNIDGYRRSTVMDSLQHAIDEHGNVDLSGENFDMGRLETSSYGPGQTFQKFSRMFDIVMMGTITPIDDQRIHMRFNFSMPREQSEENALYGNGFRDEIVRQVGQDIPIWENKIYLEEPTLCDGDGPIAKYRKWFNQFYVA